LPAYPDSAPQGTGFNTLRGRFAAELDAFIAIGGINIPGVELARNIREQPELVAAARQNFATTFFVKNRPESAVVVYVNPKAFGFQLRRMRLNARLNGAGPSGNRPDRQRAK